MEFFALFLVIYLLLKVDHKQIYDKICVRYLFVIFCWVGFSGCSESTAGFEPSAGAGTYYKDILSRSAIQATKD